MEKLGKSHFYLIHLTESFLLRVSSVNVIKSAGNLVTFAEETLNEKLRFLCSDCADTLAKMRKNNKDTNAATFNKAIIYFQRWVTTLSFCACRC